MPNDDHQRLSAGLLLTVIWHDVDVIELNIRAHNDSFSAVVTIYSTCDLLTRAAETLSSAQPTVGDVQLFTLATTDEKEASFELRVLDSVGHFALICRLGEDGEYRQNATIVIRVTPSAIDQFVDELYTIAKGASKAAALEGC